MSTHTQTPIADAVREAERRVSSNYWVNFLPDGPLHRAAVRNSLVAGTHEADARDALAMRMGVRYGREHAQRG